MCKANLEAFYRKTRLPAQYTQFKTQQKRVKEAAKACVVDTAQQNQY